MTAFEISPRNSHLLRYQRDEIQLTLKKNLSVFNLELGLVIPDEIFSRLFVALSTHKHRSTKGKTLSRRTERTRWLRCV